MNKNNLQRDVKNYGNETNPIKHKRLKYRSISSNADPREDYEENDKNQIQNGTKSDELQLKVQKPENNLEKNSLDEDQCQQSLENINELQRDAENQNDLLGDEISNISGLATSSQERYIEELEALLRQEKLKRIQLEESLKLAKQKTK